MLEGGPSLVDDDCGAGEFFEAGFGFSGVAVSCGLELGEMNERRSVHSCCRLKETD